jgi:2,4-dienoyl-CoA reductase-like NADH-dependent reductase (Old Yellow Enzyme family)
LLINDTTAPHLERMRRDCVQAHRAACGNDTDLVVGLQLTHSGRYSCQRPLPVCHDPLLDPRTIGTDCPLLDDDYLARLVDRYVAAAKLAQRSGFQFVDIKQCHRYLLSELLAAKTRPGRYGGSLENRTRLARDIISAIRAAVPGLGIATRINVFDCIPFQKGPNNAGEPCAWQAPVRTAWGTCEGNPLQPDLTEPLAWIAEMAKLGVALVNISVMHVIRPFEYPPPDGYEPPEHPLIGVDRHFRLAAQVQQAFSQLPVVGSGYSYLQEYLFHAGAANIRDGRITFVGVGRASLAQPDFALQLQEHGKLERKRTCRTFSYCTALMRNKKNEHGQFVTGCPPFDKEVYMPIWEEAKKTEGGKGS